VPLGIKVEIKELIEKASEYLPPKDIALVEQAFQFAKEAGKPNLDEALEVASSSRIFKWTPNA